MEILTLTTGIIVGILASIISRYLKKYIKDRKYVSILAKLPSGQIYDVSSEDKNIEGIEKRLESIIYSVKKELDLSFSKVDLLEDIINPSINLFKNKAQEKKISFTITSADKHILVYCDKKSMQVVVFNLIENALRYSPENSTIRIYARIDRQKLVLTIKNPISPNIKPNEIENIFKQGFRGSDSVIKDRAGYGMGLFVVQNMIERNFGKISVRQADNFFEVNLTLPLFENKRPSPSNKD